MYTHIARVGNTKQLYQHHLVLFEWYHDLFGGGAVLVLEVTGFVSILTSTSSMKVQSLVPAIVTRFSSLTFVILECYGSSVLLHGWQSHISSYSGCRKVVREWGYWAHRFTRKVLGPKYNRTRVIYSRETPATRHLPTATIPELRLALQDEWAAIPQQFIDNRKQFLAKIIAKISPPSSK